MQQLEAVASALSDVADLGAWNTYLRPGELAKVQTACSHVIADTEQALHEAEFRASLEGNP